MQIVREVWYPSFYNKHDGLKDFAKENAINTINIHKP